MVVRRKNCRLCLAPEEECVPIFSNYAADRQRLDQKIFSCVRIKVLQEDDLSQKICHACISYLNSWQSFKNRCDAAEKRQRSWTEIDRVAISSAVDRNAVIQHVKELCPGVTIESISQKVPPRLTDTADKSRTSHGTLQEQLKENGVQISSSSASGNLNLIKEEPKEQEDDNDERGVVMELDPSQFLIQSQNEENYDDDFDEGDISGGPPLLESLVLHHNNSDDIVKHPSDNETGDDVDGMQHQMVAACSVCEMTFSNRANARRHERNIHGLKQNPVNPLSAQVPQVTLECVETRVHPKSSDNTPIISTSTGIPSIDLKAKFRMKLKSERETFDYSDPSKYRHLVTPNRLAFILRNLEFLEQAQEMKCKCCNKIYPSYKYFMGHMRKKYPNLPRNVCFKCLRQFGSKGQFIGHLKRKSCINLYAIVMADESVPKAAAMASSVNEVPGTKEIIANKSYGCKLCNKEFKPKINLRQHVHDAHPEVQNSKERSEQSCAFCSQVFEDAILRRKHYNNLECITFIVCCSCGERFEEHTAYVDHVYQHHLPPQQTGQDEYGYELFDQDGNSSSSHLRNPQSCPVCKKQYNNYYNVLRHMESKHPNQLPQIYQCSKCSEGFPRQSELRDHLQTAHGENISKQQKQLLPTTQFPCKDCEQIFPSLTEWLEHQNANHARFNCLNCDFNSENREAFTVHCFMEHRNFNTSATKVQLYSCRQCTNTYNSIDNLQEHIESQHSSAVNQPSKANDGNKPTHLSFENDRVEDKPPENRINPHVLVIKTINCGLCGFVLTDFEALRQHMSKIHGMDKKFYYCNQCTAKFMNDKGLRVHLFRVHGVRDESIPTPVVSAGASLLKPIQQSTAVHQHTIPLATMSSDPDTSEPDSKASVECSVCHIVYRNNEQLKSHMQSVHCTLEKGQTSDENVQQDSSSMYSAHQPHLWFQCRYCAESFNTSKRLTIHMNTHEEHDRSDHSCKDCGGIYSTKKSLWVHRYKKHPKIPDASPCELCPRVFFDKTELFYHTSQAHVGGTSSTNGGSNGEQFHEMQCASDALFSMLDTSIVMDNRKPDDTVYQCDMCPKTFHILNALQVHRGWHFRSPDGRKVRDPNDIWQPDQLPPSKVKRMSHTNRTPTNMVSVPVTSGTSAEKRLPTCPYCYSTFASGNNLKRHIVEVHKRNESKNSTPENSSISSEVVSPSFIEKFRECTACSMKFNTVSEWIDHKLSHARVQKPSQTFEWNCEICGKAFTRKERLLQHMVSHLNATNAAGSHESQQVTSSVEIKTEDDEVEDADGDDDNVIEAEFIDNEDDDEEEDNLNESSDSNDEDDSNNEMETDDKKNIKQYFCELCQVPFNSAELLRQHVSEHFLNGGLGGNVQFSHRTSTESTSSSNSSSSSSSSSCKQQSSSDAVDSTEIKQEPT
ncbi:zinc finger protein hangover isoform X2 [Aedes albopictus]|uniref:Uncharacterized protein n=1 Tax=Aedes albopictus TaxID=7160 RepID=A0ABM1Z7U7_AEDAL